MLRTTLEAMLDSNDILKVEDGTGTHNGHDPNIGNYMYDMPKNLVNSKNLIITQ